MTSLGLGEFRILVTSSMADAEVALIVCVTTLCPQRILSRESRNGSEGAVFAALFACREIINAVEISRKNKREWRG